jgi:hypothetical protein
MTPSGGNELARMRHRGKRPPGLIWVTEDPEIARVARARGFFVLMFEPGNTYDWTVGHRLDLAVVTNLNREKAAPICTAIMAAEPLSFCASYRTEGERDVVIPYGTCHAAR